jgi:gag-polypeptide of LTR copia-type
MWMNLEAVHESQSHETITSYICNLFRTYAEEEDDIIEHVNKLKQYWERISILGDENFKFSDHLFRVIITSSLPPSWDAFMLRSGVFFTQKK